LKDQTEDIDLPVGVTFEYVHQALMSQGFTVVDEPEESYGCVGKTVERQRGIVGFGSISSNGRSSRNLDHQPNA
jgi:hypothetical protein